MFDLIDKRYYFFTFSALIIIPGLIALGLWGLNLAIDYTGGSLLDLRFENPSEALTTRAIRQELENLEYTSISVQLSGDDTVLIRLPQINNSQKNVIQDSLAEVYGVQPIEQRFEAVGPSVGTQVTQGSLFAVFVATVGILAYLSFAFRGLENPLRYGIVTVVALGHDVLIVMALAAITGEFLGWEVDALFLTALLTVIGFSVHDSIVVFDRVRENLTRYKGQPLESIVNHSVIQTLDRSINTQITALFTLVAIYLFGGGPIQQFVLWLIVGLISGTYSSICTAAPLLVAWENGELGRLIGRSPQNNGIKKVPA